MLSLPSLPSGTSKLEDQAVRLLEDLTGLHVAPERCCLLWRRQDITAVAARHRVVRVMLTDDVIGQLRAAAAQPRVGFRLCRVGEQRTRRLGHLGHHPRYQRHLVVGLKRTPTSGWDTMSPGTRRCCSPRSSGL
jgi:hypothetical protein